LCGKREAKWDAGTLAEARRDHRKGRNSTSGKHFGTNSAELSFAYFSLAAQRKVRDKLSINRSVLDNNVGKA
jgi:hypothetical protein